jgi:hypothetical protein
MSKKKSAKKVVPEVDAPEELVMADVTVYATEDSLMIPSHDKDGNEVDMEAIENSPEHKKWMSNQLTELNKFTIETHDGTILEVPNEMTKELLEKSGNAKNTYLSAEDNAALQDRLTVEQLREDVSSMRETLEELKELAEKLIRRR